VFVVFLETLRGVARRGLCSHGGGGQGASFVISPRGSSREQNGYDKANAVKPWRWRLEIVEISIKSR